MTVTNISHNVQPPLHELTATEAAKAIRAGRLTSEALVTACMERVKAREPEVQAWAFLDPERALAEARRCDSMDPVGPLHGIPVGIKDVFDTVGMPTEYGSTIYEGHVPAWDAACVAQIRAAGGIIMGKTTTTEFAARRPGPTRHPLNPEFTPGGSSSGSGAAVCDQMVPLALGSQTLGSVIRPAAYCGVVGYKPTYGAINRMGLRILSEALDTIGLFARSIEDVALLGAVLTGYGVATETSRSLRLVVCRSPQWPHAQPETGIMLNRTMQRLQQSNVEVNELEFRSTLEGIAEAADIVSEYEIGRALSYEWIAHRNSLSQPLAEIVERGLDHPRTAYEAAQRHLEVARRAVAAIFNDYDAILTPSAPGEAPRGLQDTGPAIFNKVWTGLHLPCVNVPVGWGPNQLPMGLQVIGARDGDRALLGTCARLVGLLEATLKLKTA